ncbi:MAG: nitroreductase family protein [Kiritimatiellia bacterium]|jgi:nitroreductase
MALLKQIQQRYSARSYQRRPVEKEKLEIILQAARLAPSANNKQEWRFLVVQDADTRKKLCIAANKQAFVAEAPVIIVCCSAISDNVMRCGHMAYPIDVAIAMEHMALQAVEEGLGTCWIGSFYEDQVKAVLGIPPPVRVVELMAMGYPADAPRDKSRLPLEQIVCHERWKFV